MKIRLPQIGEKRAKQLPVSQRAKQLAKGGSDELWTLLKDYVDLGLECRRPFEQRWMINLAFLAGRQYTFFNQTTHTLHQLNRVRGRVRNVDNQLGWRWNRLVSDLIRTTPNMSVVPQSSENADIKAAKIGDKVLKAWWKNNKMQKKTRLLAGWIYSIGNAFVDDRWDAKAGPIVLDEKTGHVVYEGDVDCAVLGPFEVGVPFLGLGQVDLHKFPWMWKRPFLQLEQIIKEYGKEGKRVKAESVNYPYGEMVSILGGHSGTANSKIPGAFLVSLYMQPTSDFPKGLYLVGANGVILDKQDWPLNHYHMEHFKDMDLPGIFWGKAKLEDGIPLQKTWNKNTSSIEEYNIKMGLGKGLVPRGAKLEAEPDDTHGEWIYYNPVLGHKPEFMRHDGLPQTYIWEQERIQISFDNLFNQHHASRGVNRSDLRSEDMLVFLREQDTNGAIPTHVVYEESMEAVASRVLKRIQAGYNNERMLKIKGDGGAYEVFAFKGADLRNNTDVEVQRESSIPDSRQAREAIILNKFEKGWYGDPRDPKVQRIAQRLMEDAVYKDIHSETVLDETYARWENESMFSGEVDKHIPNAYDNHAVHLEEHNKFRKGMEYQQIRLTDPNAFGALEMRFMFHVSQHQKFLEEQQAKFLEQRERLQDVVKGKGNEKSA